LDDRDYIISQLENRLENSNVIEREENIDDRHKELLIEVEVSRKEVSDCRHTISKLHHAVDQYTLENDVLGEDKRQLEKQIQSQTVVLEKQNKKILLAEKSSDDVKRRQRNDIGDHYRLELENKRCVLREK
jgi:hypothetical protein